MSQAYGTEVPQGKYNRWCERRPLICCDEERDRCANRYVFDNNLTRSEKAAFYVHELVDCQGLEFVVFSNARINQQVILPGNIVIVPCFTTDAKETNEIFSQCTREMERRGCFIYDGWLSIADWNESNVRKAISSIAPALSVFALRASAWFSWEPKYSPFSRGGICYEFEQDDVGRVSQLTQFMSKLKEADAQALLTSIGWLSQSLRLDEPSAKFLFGVLAIESLATYIEDESPDDSTFRELRCMRLTRRERKEQRVACIRDVMAQFLDEDPERAVSSAYFDCIVGIKKRLQLHLAHVFPEDTEPVDLLFKLKVDDKTLYELRNDIAHGRIDSLSEEQREVINVRAWDVERTARDYILQVLRTVTGQDLPKCEILETVSFRLEEGIFSHPSMYKGPIHMAEVYSSPYRGLITGRS